MALHGIKVPSAFPKSVTLFPHYWVLSEYAVILCPCVQEVLGRWKVFWQEMQRWYCWTPPITEHEIKPWQREIMLVNSKFSAKTVAKAPQWKPHGKVSIISNHTMNGQGRSGVCNALW